MNPIKLCPGMHSWMSPPPAHRKKRDEQGTAQYPAIRRVEILTGPPAAGMSPWQLQVRYDAWVALGAARAQFNMVCWHGGNEGHQKADADAWLAAGNCAMLKAAFQED